MGGEKDIKSRIPVRRVLAYVGNALGEMPKEEGGRRGMTSWACRDNRLVRIIKTIQDRGLDKSPCVGGGQKIEEKDGMVLTRRGSLVI